MGLDLARTQHSRCGGYIRGLCFRVQVALDRPNGGTGADVDHPDLEHLVGFGVVHQVVQATPGAFELLELVLVQYRVHLGGKLAVEFGRQ